MNENKLNKAMYMLGVVMGIIGLYNCNNANDELKPLERWMTQEMEKFFKELDD